MAESVALARCADYDDCLADRIGEVVAAVLDPGSLAGKRLLVKPNLLGVKNARLATTHPRFTAEVCRLLLDAGARLTVADSPAFGSAAKVARANGLAEALAELDLSVVDLGDPVPVEFAHGSIGVARLALEADGIVNLPKCKAHDQMRMTVAVKNLFGCAVGCRKALAHARWGDVENRFEAMLLAICEALPRGFSVLDGVAAMHVRGPVGGEDFPLGLVGASQSEFALDTALYGLLGFAPEDVPLWAEARARSIPGGDSADIVYPLLAPEAFDASGFRAAQTLSPVTFSPVRLVRGRVKSLCHRYIG
jgi:uncharacterized protein (DUF362 family)